MLVVLFDLLFYSQHCPFVRSSFSFAALSHIGGAAPVGVLEEAAVKPIGFDEATHGGEAFA